MVEHGKPEGVLKAKAKLDQAVREYIAECAEAWEEPEPRGMVVGWTMGVALTKFGSEGDEDMLMIESSPGLNNYMARGVADATAESFQLQASGYGDIDDE
jgi:hypothetical protein